MEADLHLGTLGIVLGLAARALNRRLESAEPAYLVEDTLGIQLRFEALEGAIDWFSFANDYFWHKIVTYFPICGSLRVAGMEPKSNLHSLRCWNEGHFNSCNLLGDRFLRKYHGMKFVGLEEG